MTPPPAPDILIVDDSEVDCYFLRRWIERSSLENPVRTFGSGPDFLAHMALVHQGDTPMPVLILIDINMPDTTGFELVEALAHDPGRPGAPSIYLYTNSDSPHDKRRADHLGVGFLEKFSSRAEALQFFSTWEASRA